MNATLRSFHREGVFRLWGVLMQNQFPILEFDTSRDAALDPQKVIKPLPAMPERVVLCFFQEVITAICGENRADVITHLGSEIGSNPVYGIASVGSEIGNNLVYSMDKAEAASEDERVFRLEFGGKNVAVVHPGVGAPLAAGFMEELIALGARKFIAVGGAGVLDRTIVPGHVIVPSAAVRDEGTSYHYLPPSREVEIDPAVLDVLVNVLEKNGVPYDIGKTWTTDAIYRETYAKIALRKAEGCRTVEMETATFLAVAKFRSVQFGQYLYGGDDVSGEVWDNRGWQKNVSTREKLFWLAVEAVLALP